jgi:hypothetical protein
MFKKHQEKKEEENNKKIYRKILYTTASILFSILDYLIGINDE